MRIAAVFLAAAAFAASTAAVAGPFAEVGDRQLRQDVELLKAAGIIKGPIDSWPLPWAQITAGLDAVGDGATLDPYLAAAVTRLDRLAMLADQRIAVDARIGATNQVSVARDFGSLARAKFDAAAGVEFNGDVLSIKLGAGVHTGQGGKAYNFEPSQIVVRLDNWALYAGYTEQWFGPGHDGALLFSNSTRPFPKVGLKRLVPDPIDLPVLRWLGPIRLDIFAGVLDEARDFRNTVTVGTRLSFAPSPRWEIGLNRAQMLCGRGRPCGLKQITNSFVGLGNSDNPSTGDPAAFANQAGNQLAGYDISYTRRFGRIAAKFYAEAEAEDFDNVILEQYGRMIGTTWSGPWGKKGASWTATLEYADTRAAALFNGTPLEKLTGGDTVYPGSFYNNSLYTSGFTYNHLPIGYWTAGDSRNLSLSGAVTDIRNRRWYGSVRSVHLNIIDLGNPARPIFPRPDGSPGPLISNPVSTSSEKFAIVTAGAELPTPLGDLRLEARYQTDSPSTPGVRADRVGFEVSLRQRF